MHRIFPCLVLVAGTVSSILSAQYGLTYENDYILLRAPLGLYMTTSLQAITSSDGTILHRQDLYSPTASQNLIIEPDITAIELKAFRYESRYAQPIETGSIVIWQRTNPTIKATTLFFDWASCWPTACYVIKVFKHFADGTMAQVIPWQYIRVITPPTITLLQSPAQLALRTTPNEILITRLALASAITGFIIYGTYSLWRQKTFEDQVIKIIDERINTRLAEGSLGIDLNNNQQWHQGMPALPGHHLAQGYPPPPTIPSK